MDGDLNHTDGGLSTCENDRGEKSIKEKKNNHLQNTLHLSTSFADELCACVCVCVCVFDQFVGLALKSLRLIHNHYFTISFLIVNLHKQYTKRKVLTLNYGKKARLQNCRIF